MGIYLDHRLVTGSMFENMTGAHPQNQAVGFPAAGKHPHALYLHPANAIPGDHALENASSSCIDFLTCSNPRGGLEDFS